VQYKSSALAALLLSFSASSADWSTTQLHLQHGDLKNPFSNVKSKTLVTTLQHSSGYQYGDNFFFVDLIRDDIDDGYQDTDYYGEWYTNFSLSKITDKSVGFGPVSDIGITLGINMAGDPSVVKYLPGIKLSWDVAGFNFLSTTITGYIDDSDGVARGGAPSQSNSWMFDIAWGKPFQIGEQKFYFGGHMEYIASRTDEFGNDVKNWILAQPQVQWDLGHAMGNKSGQLLVGIEYQYWKNKLGTNTSESAPQLLLVWTF